MKGKQDPESSQLFLQGFTGNRDYKLPNGISIRHLNKYETDFVYQEIFEKQVYLKHGIDINHGDCIFDIGANIGLFSLFVRQKFKDIKIYAFEPAPEICEILRYNMEPYPENVFVKQCGISDEDKEATFTFYPGYSILSGFKADLEQDKRMIEAGLRGLNQTGSPPAELDVKVMEELIKEKFRQKKEYTCQLRSISSIIKEHRIASIDLLKIDAERSELDVLRGIQEADWPKIKQVVMEIHNNEDILLNEIKEMLEKKGFNMEIEQEENFKESGIVNLYARSKPGSITALEVKKPGKLVTAATFTVDSLIPGFEFWSRELEVPLEIRPAPYNQVFQELLDPQSLLHTNTSGINIILIKFDDWLRCLDKPDHNKHLETSYLPPGNSPGELTVKKQEHLRDTFKEFIQALKAYSSLSPVFTLLLTCPPTSYHEYPIFNSLVESFEQELGQAIKTLSNLEWMRTADYHSWYRLDRLEDIFDSYSDAMGHIPYRNQYYNFLSTLVMRRFYSLRCKPYKVLALDCDETLWKGICGEHGPSGVEIDGLFKKFQEFLIQKSRQGFLLCLSSKNTEEDVWNVFDRNEGMLLKQDHITASRINWQPKSVNLQGLAETLNLGLDSFIFVDDNPVECADVRLNCPEVLTLQWPLADNDDSFLEHLWILDTFSITEEDKKRKDSYKANIKREKFREQSYDFKSFIENLKLEIILKPIDEASLSRVSQLTRRTNQFNFTTIRRSPKEIRDLLETGAYEGWTAQVKDRFGDYGLVGLMIAKKVKNAIELDTFLLSCRVLGRGVEYQMMAKLGEIALSKKRKQVKIVYKKTPKNEPARLFIRHVAARYIAASTGDDLEIFYPADELAKVCYTPPQNQDDLPVKPEKQEKKQNTRENLSDFTPVRKTERLLTRIAVELSHPGDLAREIHLFHEKTPGAAARPQGKIQPSLPVSRPSPGISFPGEEEKELYQRVLEKVKKIFSASLSIPVNELDPGTEIETYLQQNSLKIVEITSALNDEFTNIQPTLLFEHRTLESITENIIENTREAAAVEVEQQDKAGMEKPGAREEEKDIAIIGMNGRFPQARNIREFWENLKTGVSSITEVPADRWDKDAFFDAQGKPGKMYCQWGGFIDDIDRFEASFFNISPKEAETMDPQQRIFMEVVWGLLEDAGYTAKTLGRDTGVFVGVIASDYNTYTNEATVQGEGAYRNSDYYQVPNRISYFFDFKGPSIAVDTACSSAGTALHLACQSLRHRECSAAVVGGLNLFLHPGRFIQYSQMQVVSRDSKCRPFGEGATGTLYGEGIGAILIKPLKAAELDRDHIYAVIKGSAINSGGKTNGFTVPNPMAQADLISCALKDASVDARTISYVEAHGTGTPLGDPIEIRGLTKAFQENTKLENHTADTQYCALGSVKSNIGHLESGAAIAGIIKILLQMKYGKLAPSLNAAPLNPMISFENTPFYVQQQAGKWKQPHPRRAGLSSFGAGGVNAHFILEEYPYPDSQDTRDTAPQIILLSAKNEQGLKAYAGELLNFLKKLDSFPTREPGKSKEKINLVDLAYTLQVGRVAMEERLALVVDTISLLIEKLSRYSRGEENTEKLYKGNIKSKNMNAELLIEGREGKQFINIIIQGRKLEKLARLWISGVAIDWTLLYKDHLPRRISLPIYQFAGERYWIPKSESTGKAYPVGSDYGEAGGPHPFLGRNVSTFNEQCFKKVLSNKDGFMKDHVIDGLMVFPGVVYLEMAREAGRLSYRKSQVRKINNIVWKRPIILDDSTKEIFISLFPRGEGPRDIKYTRCQASTFDQDGESLIHAEWNMTYAHEVEKGPYQPPGPGYPEIKSITGGCPHMLKKADCYRLLREIGYHYGPGFKVIQELYYSENQAFARLELQESWHHHTALYPSLIDGALQTITVWISRVKEPLACPYVPYTVGEVEIIKPLTPTCCVLVSRSTSHPLTSSPVEKIETYDLEMMDEKGEVLVTIKDYYPRPFQQEPPSIKYGEDKPTDAGMYYTCRWEKLNLEPGPPGTGKNDCLLIFDNGHEVRDALVERLKILNESSPRVVVVKPGKNYHQDSTHVFEINPESEADYRKLFMSLDSQKSWPGKILHLWSQKGFIFNEEELKGLLYPGFYSIFYLSKVVMEQKPGHQVHILYVYPANEKDPQPQYAAVSAVVRSIHRENPGLNFKTLEISTASPRTIRWTRWLDVILPELQSGYNGVDEIKYKEQQRFVKVFKPFEPDKEAENAGETREPLLKEKGVYLITGGAGGLGLVIAGHLARQYKAHLVLTGRSRLTPAKKKKIKEIQSPGSEVVYFKADISKRSDVQQLVAKTKSRFTKIDGIIHIAGAIRDSLVLNKMPAEIEAVILPKVLGTVVLDDETRNEKMDFFLMFSSISSVIGNIGQSDYAYANRFLDQFVELREKLRQENKRTGKTISINWPWWKSGGMQLAKFTQKSLERTMGLKGMETSLGLQVFEKALKWNLSRFIFVKGDRQKTARLFEGTNKPKPASTIDTSKPSIQMKIENLLPGVKHDISQAVFNILGIYPANIDFDKNLSEFGFDSITFTDFANRVNEKYDLNISPAKFYEYPSLNAFATYLCQEHPDSLPRHWSPGIRNRTVTDDEPGENTAMVLKGYEPVARGPGGEPVAIIGMSGVFPQSRDLETFWKHLEQGEDLITEIPRDRWEWKDYYGAPGEGANKTDVKWGGFMEEVDRFDASFFGISPREAELMDPQQRIFLEIVWKTIEDAGYKASDLAGTGTGLFVGVSINDYNELLKDSKVNIEAHLSTGINNSIVANRISYLLDWHGPSEAIDTACSSSLAALRRGVDCIRSGECEMAIVGGVNVILRPKFHISFRKTGMLSKDGRCKTFDKSANGYVRSEGAGALLLKSLYHARADGDHIYAVIRGVAQNHGGRAHSLTAPNPNAQAEVIIKAFKDAQIPPHTIGYIETHGTGTYLGDPVEINALKMAFEKLYQNYRQPLPHKKHCGIGAVKTNTGHLECASGVAGIIKVLLSMKYKKLPAAVHFKELNPHIQLESTPFYVITGTQPWQPFRDDENRLVPRRAGVSSFGFGGTNVHVILEEYESPTPRPANQDQPPFIIVLSAKEQERLKAYAREMVDFLNRVDDNDNTDNNGSLSTPHQEIIQDLLKKIAEISQVNENAINIDEDISEYGFDQTTFARLSTWICQGYDLEISWAVFHEHPSIHSLAQYLTRMRTGCQPGSRSRSTPISLTDLAYTLSVGREPMNKRLALIVSDIKDLKEKLLSYCKGESHPGDFYTGNVEPHKAKSDLLIEGKPGEEFVKALIKNGELEKIARLWVLGVEIDWRMLYQGKNPQRISLPTYPFARERYWVPVSTPAAPPQKYDLYRQKDPGKPLHILIDRKEPFEEKLCFKKKFTGEESFIKDHWNILPGVVYLEMVRAAAKLANPQARTITLKNIIWSNPLFVKEGTKEVDISLYPKEKPGNLLEIKVSTEEVGKENSPAKPVIHMSGILQWETAVGHQGKKQFFDIEAILKRCSGGRSEAEAFYKQIDKNGAHLGPAFYGMQEFYYNPHEALARLEINQDQEKDFHSFILHPTLTNAALQTMVCFGYKTLLEPDLIYLPYVLGELELVDTYSRPAYAYVRRAAGQQENKPGTRRFDALLLDNQGQILVKIKWLSFRPINQPVGNIVINETKARGNEIVYYEPVWEKLAPRAGLQEIPHQYPHEEKELKSEDIGNILLFDTSEKSRELLKEKLHPGLRTGKGPVNQVILVKPGEKYRCLTSDTYEVNPGLEEDYHRLLDSLGNQGLHPGKILHFWSQEVFSPGKETIDNQLQRGVYPVFYITRALMKRNFEGTIPVLYFFPGPHDPHDPLQGNNPVYAAVSGFARCVPHESRKFIYKIIETRTPGKTPPGITPSCLMDIVFHELKDEENEPGVVEIRCDCDDAEKARYVKYVKRLAEFDPTKEVTGNPSTGETVILKENGVYLVTGGLGELGLIFAGYLARELKAKLVLSDCQDLLPGKEAGIQKLKAAGAEVMVVKTDVSRRQDVENLIVKARARFGRINGILHCAGVTRDSFLLNKTREEMDAVLAPKVYGTIYLDEITRDEELDFFVLFSSLTAVVGNPGQCDYGYANSFMDHFAAWRENQQAKGKRPGKTLSINWPLWKEGGIKMNKRAEAVLFTARGMNPLTNETGWDTFQRGLAQSRSQIIAAAGDREKIAQSINSPGGQPTNVYLPRVEPRPESKNLREKFQEDLLEMISGLLKIPGNKLDFEKKMSTYGFDSISFIEFSQELKGKFNLSVTPDLFFDYSTIGSLASYLWEKHRDRISQFYREREKGDVPIQVEKASYFFEETAGLLSKGIARDFEPIAVIGMSGVMPQSNDLETFWKNLAEGKDLVTEITRERWESFGCKWLPTNDPQEINARYGGFLSEVDKFDAAFFNISGREAQLIDPQQRIFLETVWKAIEDAGYKVSDLSGTRTGLFVGVANSDYYDVIRDAGHNLEAYVTTGIEHSVLANRISYLLDLRGPSEPINTACSSSLLAVHRAAEALQNEECDLAIAGGINVINSRAYYFTLTDAGMLSREGRCKAFDKNANGYVRGEGSGALVLKPLHRALKDGDYIYAIIKGTAVNHGGQASSLTAPNANAQAQLLIDAYTRAGTAPDTLGYIEAHGTGTELGDPIEINGLKKAFDQLYQRYGKTPKQNHIGIGTVKANIGHLESAAGIAGVIKVILAMKYRKIPGSIHLKEINPYIRLEDSPFYLVKETRPWEVLLDDQLNPVPRRGGISSFGFGGVNVHVVLEEGPLPRGLGRGAPGPGKEAVITLSAKNEERLKVYAGKLKDYLETTTARLEDIAYTLQVGREPMRERLAVVVSTPDQLKEKLAAYSQGNLARVNPGLYTGSVKTNKSSRENPPGGKPGLEPHQLAQQWVAGVQIDWNLLYPVNKPHRIPLPTYPFARERYWVNESKREREGVPPNAVDLRNDKLNKSFLGVQGAIFQKSPLVAEGIIYFCLEWQEKTLPVEAGEMGCTPSGDILIFDVNDRLRNTLAARLQNEKNHRAAVLLVTPGECYSHDGEVTYTINPASASDYGRLLDTLSGKGLVPGRIIHLWSMDGFPGSIKGESLNTRLNKSLYSLFYLTRALMAQKTGDTVRLVVVYPGLEGEVPLHYSSLCGFARSLRLENPAYIYKTVAIPFTANAQPVLPTLRLAEVLSLELDADDGVEVSYDGNKRYVKGLREFNPGDEVKKNGNDHGVLKLKKGGVYLITGGTGALGLILARYLAREVKAKLVLSGRSPLDEEKKAKINALEAAGAEVLYFQADISEPAQARMLLAETRSRFGRLNAVIHCAGVLRDAFLVKKTREEIAAVLAAKVYGTLNLDEACKNENLDFFVMFSSIASVKGNIGQCDYAYANSFMDHFASERERRRKNKECSGITISINWPLWEEGGMSMPGEDLERLNTQWGIEPLPTGEGIRTFEEILSCGLPQCLVVYGDADVIRQRFNPSVSTGKSTVKTAQSPASPPEPAILYEKTGKYLRKIFSDLIQLPMERIDLETGFEEYGIDSILVNKFNKSVEQGFGTLPKTLLFEYRNLNELANYFLKNHHTQLIDLLDLNRGITKPVDIKDINEEPGPGDEIQGIRDLAQKSRENRGTDDIAIIGVSGRFPGAIDIETFWENLKTGKDCITTVPWERWNFIPGTAREEETVYQWGGFLEDVDKFDPGFFNISLREAELIDPQERLFLETAWAVLEDAGYTGQHTRKSMAQETGGDIGVFVGVTTNDYPFLGLEERYTPGAAIPKAFPWSIANRVSFFFNFHGPSMPVDTGCSSSLTAIHLACESLKKGECAMAIAGGVNLYLHPNKLMQMSSMRMLSPTGRCHTFGSSSDGFVPGEGVGAVLLKPLARAVKNNDHIYAVIKGTAVNHGGRTNGYTIPNPVSQANTILSALKNARLDPRTISYIEAHGTGTSLGDPIEIEGITRAFQTYTREKQYCAIGSVKSNIGHLEGAAGIAGLTKVILQMKHRQLVPSLHAETLNPKINFADSPVYVQRTLSQWKPPVIKENAREKTCPRRAGLSSFGAGGSNAHLVLEAYDALDCASRQSRPNHCPQEPRVILLSAKNEKQLRVYAEKILRFLERTPDQTGDGRSDENGLLESMQTDILALVSRILNAPDREIEMDVEMTDYGFDPVSWNRLALQLSEKYNLEITPNILHRYSSISSISRYLYENPGEASGSNPGNDENDPADRTSLQLADVAYTLQVGRHPMEERMAVIVSGMQELIEILRQYCQGREHIENIYLGNSRKNKNSTGRLAAGEEGDEFIKNLISKGKFAEVARLWVSGVEIDWNLLYLPNTPYPQRVSLPTYPFERHVCWLNFHQRGRKIREGHREEPAGIKPAGNYIGMDSPQPGKRPEAENRLRSRFKELLGEVLYTEPSAIDEHKPFVELGLDSVLGVELVNRLNKEFRVSIKATSLYDYTTVNEFSRHLYTMTGSSAVPGGDSTGEEPTPAYRYAVKNPIMNLKSDEPARIRERGENTCDIAIIGMSGRFPGAGDTWELWENLKKGVCSVTEIPAERWDIETHYDPDPAVPNKNHCKWGGFLKDIDKFDPLFFNISPAEAVLLEPQQRLFLQEAWRAIENAGYSAGSLDNTRCGVYVGVMSYNEYNPAYMFNSTSILAARIAYFLNLKGPAISVDTACSSSLLAIHLACQGLVAGETEMMLAGGVTLYLGHQQYMEMGRSGMLSPQGKCKTFDNSADGFVPAEGVGVVVLKCLDKAIEDGDHIYGVIKGSAVNQDGKTNGITAPSANSQQQLELEVYKKSGVNPRTITYVEAHGTGTNLGDPIEMEALTGAFRQYTPDKQFCAIGSIKSNLGHTGAAAGVTGLIKVLLALQHKKIPPTLHFNSPNKHIDFQDSPFFVNTTLKDWEVQPHQPRRAAISSFGYSGTNTHLLIEEAPPRPRKTTAASKSFYIIPISAANRESLQRKITDLEKWLEREGGKNLVSDISYSLSIGRTHFPIRLALVVKDIEDLKQKIAAIQKQADKDDGFNEKEKEYQEKAALADRYIKGDDPDWQQLFQGEDCQRIAIPMYPFHQKRYWLPAPKDVSTTQPLSETRLKTAAAALLNRILFNPADNLSLQQGEPGGIKKTLVKLKNPGGEKNAAR